MYGYIYKTTDLRNNKIYVGQHKSPKFDNKYYGSGVIIKNILEKYPLDNFSCEIICECDSEQELNEKEIYWIKELGARNPKIGYNIATGGTFGDSGYHLGMLGKHQSDKQKLAASKANSYKRTEETCMKMSKSAVGNHNARGHIGKGFNGRHHSQETKDILSKKVSIIVTNYHKNLTEEQYTERCSNISKGKKGKIAITDTFKTYFINPDDWCKYENNGFYKMSLQKYNSLMNK